MSNPAPVLYVSLEIASQAETLIKNGTGSFIRDGIELLLTNGRDTFTGSETNAGLLLQRGLAVLSNTPYQALDIESFAELSDIKKAYRRCVG